jgi:hypothetical protein
MFEECFGPRFFLFPTAAVALLTIGPSRVCIKLLFGVIHGEFLRKSKRLSSLAVYAVILNN